MIQIIPIKINSNFHSHDLAKQSNITNLKDNSSKTSTLRFSYKLKTLVEYNTYRLSPSYNLNIQLKYKMNVTVRIPYELF